MKDQRDEKKRIEMEQDMSRTMYRILVITGVIANLIGTICNYLIHGTELPTLICGICLLFIVVTGVTGWITKRTSLPAVLIILMLSWFEFPYLYYCYGNTSIVYLILGIVGLAVFFPRSMVLIPMRSLYWNIL